MWLSLNQCNFSGSANCGLSESEWSIVETPGGYYCLSRVDTAGTRTGLRCRPRNEEWSDNTEPQIKALMNQLQIFLPCAAGVEDLLAHEVHNLTGLQGQDLLTRRGGVMARTTSRDVMRLNLHSRLPQRVLVQLSYTDSRNHHHLTRPAPIAQQTRALTGRHGCIRGQSPK